MKRLVCMCVLAAGLASVMLPTWGQERGKGKTYAFLVACSNYSEVEERTVKDARVLFQSKQQPDVKRGYEGRWVVTAPAAKMAKEITNSIGMKLVYVPAGKFTMGSPVGEEDRSNTETQHEVEITKGFYMGVYEVTQGEYEMVMGTNPGYFSAKGDGKGKVEGMDTTRFPVEWVSWQDAQDFLNKLNARAEEKKMGRKYRLPTEAQWEYAARRGRVSKAKESDPFSFGKSLSSTQANFYGDTPYGGAEKGPYLGRTCKVGSYAANGLGIHDMHGNVLEWCADRYAKDYYANSSQQDPPGPQKGLGRVIRGGGWDYDGRYCRSADRYWSGPASRRINLGFRVLAVPSRQGSGEGEAGAETCGSDAERADEGRSGRFPDDAGRAGQPVHPPHSSPSE